MTYLRKILLLSIATYGAAFAGPVSYIQDGWISGGPLRVFFDGVDLDVDGWIERPELITFQADYDLPGGGLTTWLLSDIEQDGFLFADAGNFLIFASNANYTLVDTAFEGEVLGSVFDQFLFPIDDTQGGLNVVPEPSTILSGAFAMTAGLAYLRRRRL